MAGSTTLCGLMLLATLVVSLMPPSSSAAMVPAVYVFGDSQADVGNNNFLRDAFKADFPHNGMDYPSHKPTGRFNNGKNFVDFLEEKLGIQSTPPYLSKSSSSNRTLAFLNGVNFASGGGGILDSTNPGMCLTLNKQIAYYYTVYMDLVQHLGSHKAHDRLAKSIFTFVIGSNDIISYSLSTVQSCTPQEFVDSMINALSGQLKTLYNLGARKFMFAGTPPVGCAPAQRIRNSTGDCFVIANSMSALYNRAAASLLHQMRSELGDMNYSFLDTHNTGLAMIHSPASYGFSDVKSACCGIGKLRAVLGCLPFSKYCPHRKEYLFWDFYHASEATVEIFASLAFEGSQKYVYPINVGQLSAL